MRRRSTRVDLPTGLSAFCTFWPLSPASSVPAGPASPFDGQWQSSRSTKRYNERFVSQMSRRLPTTVFVAHFEGANERAESNRAGHRIAGLLARGDVSSVVSRRPAHKRKPQLPLFSFCPPRASLCNTIPQCDNESPRDLIRGLHETA